MSLAVPGVTFRELKCDKAVCTVRLEKSIVRCEKGLSKTTISSKAFMAPLPANAAVHYKFEYIGFARMHFIRRRLSLLVVGFAYTYQYKCWPCIYQIQWLIMWGIGQGPEGVAEKQCKGKVWYTESDFWEGRVLSTTRKHPRTHTTPTNTYKHPQTPTNTHKHIQTHTKNTDTHKHSQTHTNTHKHTQTPTNTHKHPQTNTHTLAHTNTHSPIH